MSCLVSSNLFVQEVQCYLMEVSLLYIIKLAEFLPVVLLLEAGEETESNLPSVRRNKHNDSVIIPVGSPSYYYWEKSSVTVISIVLFLRLHLF